MKKQVFNNLAIAFMAVLVSFTSCQKDDKELTVEFETIEFAVNPTETKIVSIYSDTEWSAEIQQAGTWLSVTPTSGRNDGTLTITAQVNDDFAERYATIILTGADVKDRSIAVMQQGNKTKDVILLEEMHRIDNRRYTFEYDDQHRLTKRYEYSSNGTLEATMTLTYNHDGILATELWYGEFEYPKQFTKNGNKISFWGIGISSYEIDLNAEELPEKLTYYWQGSMYPGRSTTTHIYTWLNRNLTQADYNVYGERYGEAYEESGTYTYTYDDKKSPFYYCATPRWFWFWYFNTITACGLNNLVSVKSGDEITTYEYTYNEDGFLATKKQGGGTITYTYKRRPGTGNIE